MIRRLSRIITSIAAAIITVAIIIPGASAATMNGYDVSSWQAANITATAPGDFALIKATEGTTYVNPYLGSQADGAIRTGKAYGFYHYADGWNAEAEAARFINVVRPYIGKAVLALDWESNGNNAWGNSDWIRRFVNTVHSRTGVWPVIYVQASSVGQVSADVRQHCALWKAQYASMAPTGYQGAPWNLGSAGESMLQYTSSGYVGGHGPLDLNLFLGDRTAWQKIARGDNTTATVPAPPSAPQNAPSQRVTAPAPQTTTARYTVRSGDNLSSIAAEHGLNWVTIANANGIRSPYVIYPGQVLTLTGNATSTTGNSTTRYTVSSGDTLSAIGARYGVAWTTIAARNGLVRPYTIYPGQSLVISGTAVRSTVTRSYVVSRGDTLSDIGRNVGTAWTTIAARNGIYSPYTIYPGQVLRY